MTAPSSAARYAAVRTVATALRLWENGDIDAVNGTVRNMPLGLFVGASLTLSGAAFAALASKTGQDFDLLVEGVCAELIGLESGGYDEQG